MKRGPYKRYKREYSGARSPGDKAMKEADGEPWLALRLAVIYQAIKDVEKPTVDNVRPDKKPQVLQEIRDDAATFLHELQSAAKPWAEAGSDSLQSTFNARRMDYKY